MRTVLKDPSLCGMEKRRVSRSRSYEWLNVLGLNIPFSVAESKAGKSTVAWRLAGGAAPSLPRCRSLFILFHYLSFILF